MFCEELTGFFPVIFCAPPDFFIDNIHSNKEYMYMQCTELSKETFVQDTELKNFVRHTG